jgi:Zn-dependent protease with chaperone function
MDAGISTPQTWTIDDVERYLARPVPPVRTSIPYQAGLVLVTFALILLQAIYVAMVLLAAYGTWRYLLAIPEILRTLGGMNQVSLIMAIAPLVAGALATFFLLKPFLARPARLPDSCRVTRSEQPVLFAFIDRLCDRLGSPRPSAIELDLQVNASARLSGWLSLFRSDPRLTIGVPLAAGLTLPQFSGILAHEFGHFSHHAGMRLYFLIERIRR